MEKREKIRQPQRSICYRWMETTVSLQKIIRVIKGNQTIEETNCSFHGDSYIISALKRFEKLAQKAFMKKEKEKKEPKKAVPVQCHDLRATHQAPHHG